VATRRRVAEALAEARALKAALTAAGAVAFACESISAGQDWADAISAALSRCKVVCILGSATYGAANASGALQRPTTL
jgi:hypothetical protein